MKVIIAGSRKIEDYELLVRTIASSGFKITEVVSGGAGGVDRMGMKYAQNNNIPIKVFPPDWQKYGGAAGPKRNEEMAKYADALLALWDGVSKGTLNMLGWAERVEIPIYCVTINKSYREIATEDRTFLRLVGVIRETPDYSLIQDIIADYQHEIERLTNLYQRRIYPPQAYHLEGEDDTST